MKKKPWIGGIGRWPFRESYCWELSLRCAGGVLASRSVYTRRDTALRGLRRSLKRMGIDPELVEIES